MICSIIQSRPVYLDAARSASDLEPLLARTDADLVVLPELSLSGYFFDSAESLARVAEPAASGPTFMLLHRWARETGATYVAGFAERGEEGAFYNSALVVDASGLRAVYRKAHLFYEETTLFSPGQSLCLVEATTRGGEAYRLGVMVCFDWLFPEYARSLALKGADVIAHPANLVLPYAPQAMPIRALENRVYTATANRVGTETHGQDSLTFIGQSLVCAPDARVLASAPADRVAVLHADLDLAAARTKRLNRYNDLFEGRRPDLYVT